MSRDQHFPRITVLTYSSAVCNNFPKNSGGFTLSRSTIPRSRTHLSSVQQALTR